MQLGWTRDEILLVVACILVNQNSDAISSQVHQGIRLISLYSALR